MTLLQGQSENTEGVGDGMGDQYGDQGTWGSKNKKVWGKEGSIGYSQGLIIRLLELGHRERLGSTGQVPACWASTEV